MNTNEIKQGQMVHADEEAGGLDGSGAKVAASLPRTEWGPTEAELLLGYAQCAGGVA
jgi:hypothetical protein